MTTKQNIDLIIARFISGVATTQDIVLLSQWLESDPANSEVLMTIKHYWSHDTSSAAAHNDENFDAVLDKIRGAKDDNREIPKGRKPRNRFARLLSISAVFAVLIALTALWFHNNPIERDNYVIRTGGSVSTFDLPDGTTVSLNKNSSLSYTDFGRGKNRVVAIDGEVWFDVAHDQKSRFVVEMGSSKITVFGTSFIAKYKKDEHLIKTSLVEGSLRFENSKQSIMLTPSNRLTYNSRTGDVNIEVFDPEIETAWKDNVIRYKSMKFVDFVRLLEQKYEVPIHMSGSSLDTLLITGSVGSQQSIEQVLDIIKYVIPYRWEHINDDYVIYPQNQ